VDLRVELLKTVSLEVVIDVAAELGLVALLIVVGERLHVLGNVATEDVLAEGLGVELLGLNVEAGEAILRVRDEEATVGSTLHGTEDTGTGGSADETDIQEDLEWAALLTIDLGGLSECELTISLLNTGESLIQFELLERATSEKETSAVSGGPVSKAVLRKLEGAIFQWREDAYSESVGLELVGVRGHEDLVAADLGAHDLSNDVAVGEADDEAVLGRIVLVLGLGRQALAGIVVGLSLSATLVLDLVPPGPG
jgi:hypothetical protein